MHENIRWGILGCGKIAHKFASDLKLVKNSELVAVGSRDAARGEAFGKVHGARHAFTDYEALAASPEVDVIYIATPHGMHYDNVMMCLDYGKAVLCEKAFGLNSRQVKEMVGKARQKGIFLMEAFWTKFLPQYQEVTRIVRDGLIGDIKVVQADFGFKAPVPPAQRLYDPLLGGGSLLDIGLYPVFMAQSILGKPVEVHAITSNFDTGVDEQCVMTLKFGNGALAVLSSTFAAETPVEAMIAGTLGRIHLRNRFHNAMATMELVIGRDDLRKVEVPREEGFGYQYEARHVAECLRKGLTESPVMRQQDSIDLMDTLDRLREACGVRYPAD